MMKRFGGGVAACFAGACTLWTLLSPLCAAETAEELLTKYQQLFQAGKNEEAAEILRRPELENDPRRWFGLGQIALTRQDFAQAAACFRQGARKGSWACKLSLGVLLQRGCPGMKKDETGAFRLIREAADESKAPQAAFEAGRMLTLGIGTKQDLPLAVTYLEMASLPENPPRGALLLAGLANSELKRYRKAYLYLERAAKAGYHEAWENLGDLYAEGNGLDAPHPRWACLCYKAADRFAPSPRLKYNIGLTAALSGDREDAEKWMKKAAAENFAPALKFLADPKAFEKVRPKSAARDPKGGALRGAVDSHFKSERKILGTDARTVLTELGKLPEITGKEPMLYLPQPPGLYLKSWCFSREAVEAKIAKSLFLSREGDERWFDDTFRKEPVQENLYYPNPTIRMINYAYEDELKEALLRSKYTHCTAEFTQKLVKELDPEMIGKQLENDVWQIEENLFFHIHRNFQGRWQLRTYSFIGKINGKYVILCSFDTPPGKEDADMAVGLLARNESCLNNIAVKLAEGKTNSIFRQDDEAETIFKFLIGKRDPVAAYNLAVLCRNRNRKDLAAKYLALAKQFAAEKKVDVKLP